MMRYYFAYGSNMDKEQMRERCPDHKFVCVAILKEYKFVYDGYSRKRCGAVANIVKSSKEEKVWGVL